MSNLGVNIFHVLAVGPVVWAAGDMIYNGKQNNVFGAILIVLAIIVMGVHAFLAVKKIMVAEGPKASPEAYQRRRRDMGQYKV